MPAARRTCSTWKASHEISAFLAQELRPGDGLVFLSAGNLTRLAHEFAADMEAQGK